MTKRIAIALLLFMTIAGCGAETQERTSASSTTPGAKTAAPRDSARPAGEATSSTSAAIVGSAADSAPAPDITAGLKLIRRANLEILILDYDRAKDKLQAIVKNSGGFISDVNLYSEQEYKVVNLSLRIPSENFETTLQKLRDLGRVVGETLETDDITTSYVDTDARLRNMKLTEERLLDLLERRSRNLSDILQVERELSRVRGDIENQTARLRHFDDQVSLSTISLELREEMPEIVEAPQDVWQPVRELKKNAGALVKRSFAKMVGLVVYLIKLTLALLPWLVVFGPIGYLLYRWRRKRKNMRR
jgi:cell division septum initiation protein DivIVA